MKQKNTISCIDALDILTNVTQFLKAGIKVEYNIRKINDDQFLIAVYFLDSGGASLYKIHARNMSVQKITPTPNELQYFDEEYRDALLQSLKTKNETNEKTFDKKVIIPMLSVSNNGIMLKPNKKERKIFGIKKQQTFNEQEFHALIIKLYKHEGFSKDYFYYVKTLTTYSRKQSCLI